MVLRCQSRRAWGGAAALLDAPSRRAPHRAGLRCGLPARRGVRGGWCPCPMCARPSGLRWPLWLPCA